MILFDQAIKDWQNDKGLIKSSLIGYIQMTYYNIPKQHNRVYVVTTGKAGWIVTPCKQIVISPDAGVAGLVIIGGPNITSTTPYNGLQVACSTTVPAPPITLPIADAGAVWALGVAASHVIGYVYSL